MGQAWQVPFRDGSTGTLSVLTYNFGASNAWALTTNVSRPEARCPLFPAHIDATNGPYVALMPMAGRVVR